MSNSHFERSARVDEAGREAMLNRIRRALNRQAGEPTPEPVDVDAELLRINRPEGNAEPVERFARAAAETGMEVVNTSGARLTAAVVTQLNAWGVERLVLPDGERWRGLDASLAAEGFTILPWRAGRATNGAAFFDADAGITGTSAAIAETGTLVLEAGPDQPRSLCLVPPAHLAIVHAGDIAADMSALFAKETTSTPSERLLITGPSKTADIEGVLIKGVHGPGRVCCVIVR